MRVGHLTIKHGLQFEIWDGSSRLYTVNTLLEAMDLADDLYEEDLTREEAAQYGPGIGADRDDRAWKYRREPAL